MISSIVTDLCKRLVSAWAHSDSTMECQIYMARLAVGVIWNTAGQQKAAQQPCRASILHLGEAHHAVHEAGQQESLNAHNAVAKHRQALLGIVRLVIEHFLGCVDSTALGGWHLTRKVPLQDCYTEAKITWLRRRQASESHWMRMMLLPNMIRRLPARAASNCTGSSICRLHCSGRNTLLNSFSTRPSGVPVEHAWHLK